MAHFAEIDDNNIVRRVVVISNDILLDEDGVESEALGVAFCQQLYPNSGTWLQTSYNSSVRKNYASVGMKYRSDLDAFVTDSPDPDWVFNEETCRWEPPASWTFNDETNRWEPPVERPDSTDSTYRWNETNQTWDEIDG
jgi:hypothetical protein